MTIKVYKFRGIDSCDSAERAEQILLSGEFWCSRFWEMNDPMEGIYHLNDSSTPGHIEETFKNKASQLICCFSGEEAVENPAMWGYYANGFKGIAIEVEVDEALVQKMNYEVGLQSPDFSGGADDIARKVLCQKQKAWEHEREFRFLTDKGANLQRIGRITGLLVGYSYPKMIVHPNVDHRWASAAKYGGRVKRLIEIAHSNGTKLHRAQMKNAVVQIDETNAVALKALL